MKFVLVTIFVYFGGVKSENSLVVKDFPSETEVLSENNIQPIPLTYQEISDKVHHVAMNIDAFVDILINAIKLGGRSVDPIQLSDVTETFSDKILFVNIDGQFIMRNGELHNIKSIQRHGNATLKYDNMKLYIDTGFLFNNLDFNYDFISKIVAIGPRGYMTGTAYQLILETVFVYDIMHNKLSLDKTSVVDKVPIDVKVHVSVVTDWLANPIISWLSSLYEQKILLEIQSAVEQVIRSKLPLPHSFLGENY